MENPVSRRCLFVGTVTRDILMELEEPPASDRRLAARRVTSASGGPAATAAAAFADLGGRGGLIAPVGWDENGETVGRDLSALGLAPLSLPVLDGPTAFSVILVEPGGKRCIVHYGGCVQGLVPDLLTPELLAGADVVHLAGMTGPQAVALARRCREVRPEAQLSVDGGNLDGPSLEVLAGLSDLLVPDDKTVQKSLGLDPEAACRRFARLGVRLAAVTCGDQGSVALWDGALHRIAACPVEALDTTGAGDNFHGALLYALCRGDGPEAALRLASAYAALTCTALGGRAAKPGLRRTEDLARSVYETERKEDSPCPSSR